MFHCNTLRCLYSAYPMLCVQLIHRAEVSAHGVQWKNLSKGNKCQLISCPLTDKSYTYNIMVRGHLCVHVRRHVCVRYLCEEVHVLERVQVLERVHVLERVCVRAGMCVSWYMC